MKQKIEAYKNQDDMYDRKPLELNFIVNENRDFQEQYKTYATGVAWGLTSKYSHPYVCVFEEKDGNDVVVYTTSAYRVPVNYAGKSKFSI